MCGNYEHHQTTMPRSEAFARLPISHLHSAEHWETVQSLTFASTVGSVTLRPFLHVLMHVLQYGWRPSTALLSRLNALAALTTPHLMHPCRATGG